MAVIWFGRNVYRLFVVFFTFILITMSLHPVDCAMTAEESIAKLLSAEYVLRLNNITLADDHIRASLLQQHNEAQLKWNALNGLRSRLLQMDAHEPIPSPYEKTVQEMEDALGRLPQLASLDPFLAQVRDKCTEWAKPLSAVYFKRTSLDHDLAQNPDNQAVSGTLQFYNYRYQVIEAALKTFESSLDNYCLVWMDTQVRPKQANRLPVVDALEKADQVLKEKFTELYVDKPEPPFPWLKVSCAIAGLAIIILLVGVLALLICVRKKRSTRAARIVSSRSSHCSVMSRIS